MASALAPSQGEILSAPPEEADEPSEINNKFILCIISVYFTCILTLIQLEIDGWNLQKNPFKIIMFILIIPILIFIIVIIRYNTEDNTILQVFIIPLVPESQRGWRRSVYQDIPNLHTFLNTENTADEVIELNTTLVTCSSLENTCLSPGTTTECPICLEEMFYVFPPTVEVPGTPVAPVAECIKVCGPEQVDDGSQIEPGINHIFHKDCFKNYLISSYIQQYESIYRNNRGSEIVTGQEIKWLCPICKRDITNSLE